MVLYQGWSVVPKLYKKAAMKSVRHSILKQPNIHDVYSVSLHACLETKAYFSSESTDMMLPLLAGEDFCNSGICSCCTSSSDSHPPPAWPGTCAGRVRIPL
jgi:hypothetical protein